MNIKARAMMGSGTALMLASFVWAGSAMAQEDEDVAHMSRPADDAASCKEMNWNAEFVGSYPWVAEACHTVVVVNGEKWARFEGKFQRTNRDGSFDTEFVSRSNRDLGRVTLMPEPGQRVHIDNQDVRFSDLSRDQVLSFYVPEGAIGFAVEPGVEHTRLVKVVKTTEESEYATESTANEQPANEQPVQLAQADTQPSQPASRLPSTAGPLPLIALGGLMSLLGGLGLTLRRKTSKQSS